MDFIVTLHSHMRHLVLLTGAVAVLLPLIALLRKKQLSSIDRMAVRVFSGIITLQFLLGTLQLAWRWNDFGDGLRHRLEHAAIMLVAVGIVHMATARWKRLDPAQTTRQTFILMFGSVLLVLLGILILPQGRVILGLE